MISILFVDVRDNYGKMLDGHTSIDNIMDTQGVVFNIKNIASLPAHIANTILYETLSMCWDNCTRNGLIMKQLYEEGNYAIDKVEKIKSDKKLPKFSRIMDFVKWILLWVKVCIILVFIVILVLLVARSDIRNELFNYFNLIGDKLLEFLQEKRI